MKRSTLETIVKKYYLSGLNEVSKWKIDNTGKTLKIGASTPNSVLAILTEVSNFTELPTGEFGVNDTSKLLKMINVLDDEITLTPISDASKITGIQFNSDKTEVHFVTADLKIINDNKMIKMYSGPYPEFDIELILDKDFIDTYSAARAALSDSEYVVFQNNNKGKFEMVFGQINGGNKILNTSKIRYNPQTTEGKCTLPHSIAYNADYLKEIFNANKNAENTIFKISSNTLGYMKFKNEDVEVTYHIKGVIGK
jgi:hypothetical protein